MFQWQHVHGAEQHQHNINNIEKQWMCGVPQVGTFVTCSIFLLISPFKDERSPRWISDVWWCSPHQLPGPLLGARQAGGVPAAHQPDQGPVHAVHQLGTSQLRHPRFPHWNWGDSQARLLLQRAHSELGCPQRHVQQQLKWRQGSVRPGKSCVFPN